jgi:cation diffusion facilitator family transporter
MPASDPVLVRLGPHGGPLVQTERGSVEVSVFETNVSPRFRLYFADPDGTPQRAPEPAVVTLETVRRSGARQAFAFASRDLYLESTADIPEPHEFTVKLSLGWTDVPELQFTEEAHAHDHERSGQSQGGPAHGIAGHSHGADAHDEYHHEHATGRLGWLRGLFGHSHSVVDRIDSNMESNARGIWALKVSLLALGLTAFLQAVVALVSGSVGLLADTIHNFADAGTSLPLWLAFALGRRGPSRRFTYGYGKTEDVAGVVIVLIIFSSACVAAWESVYKIIHPEPVQHLGWVAAAALIGFIGNEAVAVLRIRVGHEIGSAALVADGQHARVDGFTSLAVLVGAAGVYLGVPLLDPLVGLGITLAILVIVKDAAATVWIRLIDGIEPEILDAIAHSPTHVDGVRAVRSVRARWVGHQVYSDVEIAVDPALRVPEADAIAKAVERSLRDHVRLLGEVVVRVVA